MACKTNVSQLRGSQSAYRRRLIRSWIQAGRVCSKAPIREKLGDECFPYLLYVGLRYIATKGICPVPCRTASLFFLLPAWWAAVYGVTQSWTRLKWLSSSNETCECKLIDHRQVIWGPCPSTNRGKSWGIRHRYKLLLGKHCSLGAGRTEHVGNVLASFPGLWEGL